MYGTASITSALPLVIKYIEDTKEKIKSGKGGRYYKAFHIYLDDLEPIAIAAIALKVTFDKVFST